MSLTIVTFHKFQSQTFNSWLLDRISLKPQAKTKMHMCSFIKK